MFLTEMFISCCQALEQHEETKEVSKRVQLLLKEETAAVQTKLVRLSLYLLLKKKKHDVIGFINKKNLPQ